MLGTSCESAVFSKHYFSPSNSSTCYASVHTSFESSLPDRTDSKLLLTCIQAERQRTKSSCEYYVDRVAFICRVFCRSLLFLNMLRLRNVNVEIILNEEIMRLGV